MTDQEHVAEPEAGAEPEVSEPQRPERETVKEYRGAGIMWGAIGLALVLAVFLIIVIQNGQNVELDFLWLTAETPLSLIVAVTVAASLLLGEGVGFVWRRRRRSRLQEREELSRLRRGRRGR
jgi:uncharacterized integral membrane protein